MPVVRWVSGSKRAQALDGVAEELDAHRRLPVRREDVEDASPACDLAGRGDRILAAIPTFVQRLEEDLGREVFTALDRDDARLEQARRQDRPQESRRRGDQGAQPPAQGRVHGRRPPQRGLRMAGQAAERCGARRGQGEHRAQGARFLRERAQVLRHPLDQALRVHDDQERRAGDEQGDEQAGGTGQAVEGDETIRGQAAARLRDLRMRGDGGDPGRRRAAGRRHGEARRAHGRRMRASRDVVERPGVRSTRTTRPPPASTSARPTMASGAQSAPLTRTSGRRAEMTARGVSSS